jgi:hypothetical protein
VSYTAWPTSCASDADDRRRYADGNDADSLRHDAAFKLALGHLPEGAALCSQPTISRLENLPRPRDLRRMGQAMVALYCASFRQVPRRITLDIDDTFDAVQARGEDLSTDVAEATGQGHCGLPVEELSALASTLLEVEPRV